MKGPQRFLAIFPFLLVATPVWLTIVAANDEDWPQATFWLLLSAIMAHAIEKVTDR